MAQPPTSDEVRKQEALNRRGEERATASYKRAVRTAKIVVIGGITLAILFIYADVQMISSAVDTGTNPPSSGATLINLGIVLLFLSPAIAVGIHQSATRKFNVIKRAIAEMCPQCKKWQARLLTGTEELGRSEHWETVYDTVETKTRIRNPDGSYSDATSTTTQPRTARVGYTDYLNEFSCRFCGFKWKEPSVGRFVR